MHVCYPLFVVLLSANKTDTYNQIKCFEFSTNIINQILKKNDLIDVKNIFKAKL